MSAISSFSSGFNWVPPNTAIGYTNNYCNPLGFGGTGGYGCTPNGGGSYLNSFSAAGGYPYFGASVMPWGGLVTPFGAGISPFAGVGLMAPGYFW